MTSDEKKELGFAIFCSIIGGISGHFVTKKTHPVVGTIVGTLVAALAVPAAVEAAKSAGS